jgi:F-type H+-transporting ATPase subunit epsilon
MAITMHLDIVSAEKAIFSGVIEHVTVSGQEGSLGIYPGHTALLTGIRPGEVVATTTHGKVEVFYVSGGILEVQPETATILADTVLRADDIDEAAALEAQEKARKMLTDKKQEKMDYDKAILQLEESAAQIRVIQNMSKLSRQDKLGKS